GQLCVRTRWWWGAGPDRRSGAGQPGACGPGAGRAHSGSAAAALVDLDFLRLRDELATGRPSGRSVAFFVSFSLHSGWSSRAPLWGESREHLAPAAATRQARGERPRQDGSAIRMAVAFRLHFF